jgi:hypothetical protein
MTADLPASFRILSFGDVEGSLWCTAIDAGETAVAFATPDGTSCASGASAVQLTEDGEGWRLTGEGIELLAVPVRPPVEENDAGTPAVDDHRPLGTPGDEFCQVTGTLSANGTERTVQCPGVRSRGGGLDLQGLDSLRWVAAWFEADRGLALLASRPTGSKGQERDRIAATVFDADAWLAVDDPRLSTTYRDDGAPARANLELWIGDDEEEQHSRRAAAEAAGGKATLSARGIELQAIPLRCHTGGIDGAGVYLLARF